MHKVTTILLAWTSSVSLAFSHNDSFPPLESSMPITKDAATLPTGPIGYGSLFPSQSPSPSTSEPPMQSTLTRSSLPAPSLSPQPTSSIPPSIMPEHSFGSIVLDQPQRRSSDDSVGLLGGTIAGAVGVALLSLFVLKRRKKKESPRQVQVFEIPNDDHDIEPPLGDSQSSEADCFQQQSLSTIEEEDSQIDIYPVSSSEEKSTVLKKSILDTTTISESGFEAKKVHFSLPDPFQWSSSDEEEGAVSSVESGKDTRIDSDIEQAMWPESFPAIFSSNETGAMDEDHSSTNSTNSKTELLPKGESIISDSFNDKVFPPSERVGSPETPRSKNQSLENQPLSYYESPCITEKEEAAVPEAGEAWKIETQYDGMVEI